MSDPLDFSSQAFDPASPDAPPAPEVMLSAPVPVPRPDHLERAPTFSAPVPTPRPMEADFSAPAPEGFRSEPPPPVVQQPPASMPTAPAPGAIPDMQSHEDQGQRFRGGGGRVLDTLGVQSGKLTGDEAHAIRSEAIADATAERDRRADVQRDIDPAIRDAIADIQNDPRIPPEQKAAAIRQLRDEQTGNQSRTIEGRAALAQAEAAPAPVLSMPRDAMERLPKAAVDQAIDAAAAAGRVAVGVTTAGMAALGDRSAPDRGMAAVDSLARDAREGVGRAFTPDNARDKELGAQVAQGVGSTLGFIGMGTIGRAAGLGATATTAVAGGLSSAEQGYQDAERSINLNPQYAAAWLRQKGLPVSRDAANSLVRWGSFAAGFAGGATEALPIGLFFERLEKTTGGGLRRYLGAVAASAGEEGVQEGVQGLLENARKLALLDPNQNLITPDLAEQMLVGALSGGGVTGAALAGRRAVDVVRGQGQIGVAAQAAAEDKPEAVEQMRAAIAQPQDAREDQAQPQAAPTEQRGPMPPAAPAPAPVPAPVSPPTPAAAPVPQQPAPAEPVAAPAPVASPTVAQPGVERQEVAAPPVVPPGVNPEDAAIVASIGMPVDSMNPAQVAKVAAEQRAEMSPEEIAQAVAAYRPVTTVPEAPATLKEQEKALDEGRRPAVMYPNGTPAPQQTPEGTQRVETPAGTFVINPSMVTPEQVQQAVATGRENEILALGPANKADVAASAQAGSPEVAVVERTPAGTEVRAAAGTAKTAPAQIAAMEANKAPENRIETTEPQNVIDGRTGGLDFSAQADVAPDQSAAEAKAPRRAPRRNSDKPVSIGAFVRSLGGMRDDGGELAARDWNRRMFNPKAAMSIDQMREAAEEAGYLTPDRDGRTSTDELLRLLEQDERARKGGDFQRRVYSQNDGPAAADFVQRQRSRQMADPAFAAAEAGRADRSARWDADAEAADAERGGAETSFDDVLDAIDSFYLSNARLSPEEIASYASVTEIAAQYVIDYGIPVADAIYNADLIVSNREKANPNEEADGIEGLEQSFEPGRPTETDPFVQFDGRAEPSGADDAVAERGAEVGPSAAGPDPRAERADGDRQDGARVEQDRDGPAGEAIPDGSREDDAGAGEQQSEVAPPRSREDYFREAAKLIVGNIAGNREKVQKAIDLGASDAELMRAAEQGWGAHGGATGDRFSVTAAGRKVSVLYPGPDGQPVREDIPPRQFIKSLREAMPRTALTPVSTQEELRRALAETGRAITPEGVEIIVRPEERQLIVRDEESNNLVTRQTVKEGVDLIEEGVRVGNLPSTEKTEAGVQTVIPGAEKASDADMAQRGADADLKAKAPQKDTDGLALFGDRQGDLMDALAAKPAPKAEPDYVAENRARSEKAEREFPVREASETDAGYLKRLIAYADEDQGAGRFARAKEAADKLSGNPTHMTIYSAGKTEMSIEVLKTPVGWTHGISYNFGKKNSGGGYASSPLPISGSLVAETEEEAIRHGLRILRNYSGSDPDARKAVEQAIKNIVIPRGKNRDGESIFEDGNGVRFVREDGVRIYEKVTMAPDGSYAPGQTLDKRFDTAEELAELEANSEPEETAAEPDAYDARFANNKLITADRAKLARDRLKAKLSQLNSGIDPEILSEATILAVATLEAGARKFADFARAMTEDLGEAIRPFLLSAYNGARDYPGVRFSDEMDSEGDARTMHKGMMALAAPSAEPAAQDNPFKMGSGPVEAVAHYLYAGGSWQSIVQARKFVRENGGSTLSDKQIEEHIEAAVVKTGRQIAKESGSRVEAFDRLVDLYQRQPILGLRTSTSVELQAYSTPLPLAYIAAVNAGADMDVAVYEPTAGNGALLIATNPKNAVANELDKDRARSLRDAGFTRVLTRDATDPATANVAVNAMDGEKFGAVVMNPPFGAKPGADGNEVFDLGAYQPGYKTREMDHAIAFHALDKMRDDGKAALILGGPGLGTSDESRLKGYQGKAKREFYKALYDRYNVVDHYTVAGDLYGRQGAGYPVDVIVIDGKGRSARPYPMAQVPSFLSSWTQLREKVDGIEPGNAERPDVSPVAVEPGPAVGNDGRDGDAGNGGPFAVPAEPKVSGGVREGRDRVEPAANRDDGRPADAQVQSGAEPAGDSGGPRQPVVAPDLTETETQVAYQPRSGVNGLGTLVPVNMRDPAQAALRGVENQVGMPLEKFVGQKLGMSDAQVAKAFGAEQVDALALAIHNIEQGKGFIIGDQTGIGKGRAAAGMLIYAKNRGLTPVFTTIKSMLYADMYRDLSDIGFQELYGREPNILVTDSAMTLNLDNEGKVRIKTGDTKSHAKVLGDAARDGLKDYDFVFTTYSQTQSVRGKQTERQDFLNSIIGNSVLVLDESHAAGGSTGGMIKNANAAPTRAEFVRGLVDKAVGVYYSSATYAKRPDVMDLYRKTDMALAVEGNNDRLIDAMTSGKVPMQQAVAAKLVQAGQYLRRERSFAGVSYDTFTSPVDRETYNRFSEALSRILDFSEQIADVVERIDQQKKAEGSAVSDDGSTGGAGAASTNFTSVMHNLIGQLLLSAKASVAADRAIDALKNGKKPVITLSNTMESILDDVAGDALPGTKMELDFSALLSRYLDRTRWITIKEPFGKVSERYYLTDEDLGAMNVRIYDEVQDFIRDADFSEFPASPIDFIRAKITAAGYSVAEITGRTNTVAYDDFGNATFDRRDPAEKGPKGARKTIKRFNDGDLDAVILNQSGSTGISLHASVKEKDQRKRRMIIAQAEANIDTHMQMLGRVHRTGQVVTPEYEQLAADVPAEIRPASILTKKMASLNASTTASRKSAVMSDSTPDFMNEVGDGIAAEYLRENPGLNRLLGYPLDEETMDGAEGAMRKITGRIPLLPIEQQERMYEALTDSYNLRVEELEASGQNFMEAKALDLQAEVIEQQEVKPATGLSPFQEAVTLNVVNAKRTRPPFVAKDAMQAAAQGAGFTLDPNATAEENHNRLSKRGMERVATMAADALADFDAHVANEQAKVRQTMERAMRDATPDNTASAEDKEKAMKNIERARVRGEDAAEKLRNRKALERDQFTMLLGNGRLPGSEGRGIIENATIYPGARVSLINAEADTRMSAIVASVTFKEGTESPLAMSAWRATFSIPGAGKIAIPLSRLVGGDKDGGGWRIEPTGWSESLQQTLDMFDMLGKEGREQRVIYTGNILAGFSVAKNKGQIVNFTKADGSTDIGILMPPEFKSVADVNQKIGRVARSGAEIIDMIQPGKTVVSADGNVELMMDARRSTITIYTNASRSDGGKYFMNRDVIRYTGDFRKIGSQMRGFLFLSDRDSAVAGLDALVNAGASFRFFDAPPPKNGGPGNGRDTTNGATGARGEYQALDAGRPAIGAARVERATFDGRGAGLDRGYEGQPAQASSLTARPVAAQAFERNGDVLFFGDTDEDRAAIRDEARTLVGDRAVIKFVREIGAAASRDSGYNGAMEGGETSGLYDAVDNIIRIAYGAARRYMMSTVRHEAYHLAEAIGLITRREIAVLQDPSSRAAMVRELVAVGLISEQDAKKLDGSEVRAYFAEHAIARAVQGQAFIGEGLHIGARFAMTRFADLVAKALRVFAAAGSRTAASILERLASERINNVMGAFARGEMADRTPATLNQRGVYYDNGRHYADTERGIIVDERDGTSGPMVGGAILSERRANAPVKPVTPTEKASDLIERTRQQFQDFALPLRRLEERIIASGAQVQTTANGSRLATRISPYQQITLIEGKIGNELERIQNDHFEPILKAMNDGGLSAEQVGDYLYAQHAPERNRLIEQRTKGFNKEGSGMSNAEAQRVIDNFRAAGLLPALQNVEALVRQMQAGTLDTLESGGTLSTAQKTAWQSMFQHYVPLVDAEKDEGSDSAGMTPGRSYSIRGLESQHAIERRTKADNPLIYAMSQAISATMRAERAQVSRLLMALAARFPDIVGTIDTPEKYRTLDEAGNVITKNRPASMLANAIGVKVNGEQHYIVLHDQDVADALKGQEVGSNVVFDISRWLTHRFARAVTAYNPPFWLANFLRDFQEALVNIRAEDKAVRQEFDKLIIKGQLFAAVAAIYRSMGKGQPTGYWASRWKEFTEAGGRTAFIPTTSYEQIEKDVQRIVRQLGISGDGAYERGAQAMAKLDAFLDRINTPIENGIRLLAFDAARKAGKPVSEAALLAKDLTVNFNRKGSKTVNAGALYMFFNASMQGGQNMLSRLFGARKGKMVWAAAGGLMGVSASAVIASLIAGGDDDEGVPLYMRIPEWERESNIVLVLPRHMQSERVLKGFEQPRRVTVPMPHGWGALNRPVIWSAAAIMNTMRPAGRSIRQDSAAKMLWKSVVGVMSGFNPTGKDQALGGISAAAPTMTRPILHVAANQNFAGTPLYPSSSFDTRPNSQRTFEGTPRWARMIADGLNRVTGGDSFAPGAIDIAPGVIRETISGYAPALVGPLASMIGSMGIGGVSLAMKAGDGNATLSDVPMANRVLKGGERDRSSDFDFYRAREEAGAEQKRQNAARRAGTQEGAESHARQVQARPTAQAEAGRFEAATRQVAGLRRQMQALERSDMPAAEKKAAIDQIRDQITEARRRAVQQAQQMRDGARQ